MRSKCGVEAKGAHVLFVQCCDIGHDRETKESRGKHMQQKQEEVTRAPENMRATRSRDITRNVNDIDV